MGDQVIVRRAGDVIPEVVGTVPAALLPVAGALQGSDALADAASGADGTAPGADAARAAPRSPYVPNFRMPRQCPICGSTVVREKAKPTIAARGLFCPAQRKEALLHFAQRRAMDIEGLGEKLVDQLVEGQVIRTLPDLYRLGLTALSSLDRMAEKSAQNVLAALESPSTPRCRASCSAWASAM